MAKSPLGHTILKTVRIALGKDQEYYYILNKFERFPGSYLLGIQITFLDKFSTLSRS